MGFWDTPGKELSDEQMRYIQECLNDAKGKLGSCANAKALEKISSLIEIAEKLLGPASNRFDTAKGDLVQALAIINTLLYQRSVQSGQPDFIKGVDKIRAYLDEALRNLANPPKAKMGWI